MKNNPVSLKRICPICCHLFTKRLRKRLFCRNCQMPYCTDCLFKHIITQNRTTCLHCQEEESLVSLRDYFSRNRYNSLFKCLSDYWFTLERAHLKEAEKILKEQRTITEINILKYWGHVNGLDESTVNELIADLYQVDQTIVTFRYCPECQNVLSDFYCDHCQFSVCQICFCPVKEQEASHTCDQGAKASLQLMASTCKTCPECGLFIEKSDNGCDQMFCVQCKTSFSWTTGRIVSKDEINHNPHYYEWKRLSHLERNPLDSPCEGPFLQTCDQDHVAQGHFLKLAHFILQQSILTINDIKEHDTVFRQQLRINFLKRKISATKWKTIFKQHITTQLHNDQISKLLNTCLDGMYYIVLGDQGPMKEDPMTMINQLFTIISDQLAVLRSQYGKGLRYVLRDTNPLPNAITALRLRFT